MFDHLGNRFLLRLAFALLLASQTPLAAQDTGTWQRIAGSGTGYTIEYPAHEWVPQLVYRKMDVPEHVIIEKSRLTSPRGAMVEVDVWNNPSGMDLHNWLNAHQQLLGVRWSELVPTKAGVSNAPALQDRFDAQGEQAFNSQAIFFTGGATVFRVSYLERGDPADEAVFRHIVASFDLDTTGAEHFAARDAPQDDPPILVYECGGHYDTCPCGLDNPYPCCNNGGNCTWYAWDRACCIWDVALPSPWRHARYWAQDLQSNGYFVSNTPAVNTIACRDVGEFGHVAWVVGVNGNQVTVDEMSCCDGCPYGSRIWTYPADYFSGGFIYQDDPQPNPPTQLNPPDGEVFTAGIAVIVFQWSIVAGAQSYETWIDNNSGFGSPEIGFNNGQSPNWITDGIVNTAQFTLTIPWQFLLPQNVYFWKVRARDAAGQPLTEWSAVRSFTLLHPVPAAPEQVAPPNGATFTIGLANIVFECTPVSGASWYEWWIDNNSGFGSPEVGYNNGLSPDWVDDGITSGTQYVLYTAWQQELPQNYYFRKVRALDANGQPLTDWSAVQTVVLLEPSAAEDQWELPQSLQLDQNYPNPFNAATTISYDLPRSAHVQLDVFNNTGQRVATIVQADQPGGSYSVSWSAESLPSGVYIYHLEADGHAVSRKMLLLK